MSSEQLSEEKFGSRYAVGELVLMYIPLSVMWVRIELAWYCHHIGKYMYYVTLPGIESDNGMWIREESIKL